MINFRETKIADTFAEEGDRGIFFGSKSRVSTIRFEIIDSYTIDARDITINLNVSHHNFDSYNPFEQDEFAKGASLRLSIVQGEYSKDEPIENLMDDLADFMDRNLDKRKVGHRSSSKKESAPETAGAAGAAAAHRKILVSDPVDVYFPSESESEQQSERGEVFLPQNDSSVLPSPSADVDMQYNSVDQKEQAEPQRLKLSGRSSSSDYEEIYEADSQRKRISAAKAANEKAAKKKAADEKAAMLEAAKKQKAAKEKAKTEAREKAAKEKAAKKKAAKEKAAKEKAAKEKAAKEKAAKEKAAKAKAAKAKAAKAKAAKAKAAKEKAAKAKAAKDKAAKDKAAKARKQKIAKEKIAKQKKERIAKANAEAEERRVMALAAASAALNVSSESVSDPESESDVVFDQDGDDIGISDIEMEDAISEEEEAANENDDSDDINDDEEGEEEEEEEKDNRQLDAGDDTAKILQNLLSGENSKAALNKKIESSRRATIEKASRKLSKNISTLKGKEQAKISAYADERLASESRLKISLQENDKELEKVLRKRKAIIAEIKSTSVTLKRRRKELVSGMGEIVSLFKSQAGNIVQQAAALQGKKEQRMRDTRRKSVQQALGVLANHL